MKIIIATVLLAGAWTLPAQAAPRSESLATRVQRLEDHIAIERLLMEYGRMLDRRDFAAYSQLFAADGEWSGNTGTFKGPAEIKAAMEKAFPTPPGGTAAPSTFHLMTNAIIDIQGDSATAVSKWTFVRIVDGKPGIALAGRYDDTLIREQGHWKFLRRVAPAVTAPAPNE
jgi:hypothetical protein